MPCFIAHACNQLSQGRRVAVALCLPRLFAYLVRVRWCTFVRSVWLVRAAPFTTALLPRVIVITLCAHTPFIFPTRIGHACLQQTLLKRLVTWQSSCERSRRSRSSRRALHDQQCSVCSQPCRLARGLGCESPVTNKNKQKCCACHLWLFVDEYCTQLLNNIEAGAAAASTAQQSQ